ncbi:MAG: AbrB/MazE/SpoVT family DNA-binding domain-containing protein [Oscillospiraceae bacterium]|nr:AbrB/MazE/SpoVT family DNA-binding domain-containing protein [Oscillospiraceae bacterium]
MYNVGIVREIDEMGRIVLPVEMRRSLNIAEKGPLEIHSNGAEIVLKKHKPSCVFCGEAQVEKSLNGKNVCAACITDLKKKKV